MTRHLRSSSIAKGPVPLVPYLSLTALLVACAKPPPADAPSNAAPPSPEAAQAEGSLARAENQSQSAESQASREPVESEGNSNPLPHAGEEPTRAPLADPQETSRSATQHGRPPRAETLDGYLPDHAKGQENALAPRGRSLPRLELKTIGLHIGGGPNDANTQRAFGSPIALNFEGFKRCYVRVENPKEHALYGVDLSVPKGRAQGTVRRVRTTLRGEGFAECMKQAFESIRFENPLSRETMVSYSVRFSLSGL